MQRPVLIESAITHSVIGAFFDVYNTLGFGFLESLYAEALRLELAARGHGVRREVGVVVRYKQVEIGTQRIDLLVDEKVIVEVKSAVALPPTAHRQIYNYLRATGLKVGLLLHFGPEPRFHRVVCERRWRSA